MSGVDNLFSLRLQVSARALQTYPLMPFGTKVIMNGGNGGTIFPKGELVFLDSSYVNILLRYGWVTTLAMFSVWEWMLHKALRCGNRRMALVMAVIAVHSIMEHHFPDPFDNILLIMPLAALQVPPLEVLNERKRKQRYAAFAVVAVALLVSGVLFLPWLISSLRTIYGAKGWQGGYENAWPVLGLNLCIVALCYSLIRHAMGETIVGWTTTMLSIWGIGGAILLSLGVIGEYIGKIYLETKNRPRFIVEQFLDDKHGFETKKKRERGNPAGPEDTKKAPSEEISEE